MFFHFTSKRRQRIADATRKLTLAEDELTAAMAELRASDRADKRIVGERLRAAMAALVTARGDLECLGAPA